MGGHVWRIPYLTLHGGPELGVLTVVMKLSLGYRYTSYT